MRGLQKTPVTFETTWLLRKTRPPQMGQDSSRFSLGQWESSGYSAPGLRRGSDAAPALSFFFLRIAFYSLGNMLRAKVAKINAVFKPRDHAPVWLKKFTSSSVKWKLSHLPWVLRSVAEKLTWDDRGKLLWKSSLAGAIKVNSIWESCFSSENNVALLPGSWVLLPFLPGLPLPLL